MQVGSIIAVVNPATQTPPPETRRLLALRYLVVDPRTVYQAPPRKVQQRIRFDLMGTILLILIHVSEGAR